MHTFQIPTQEEINTLQKTSLVSNTERNTSKWLRVVDHFNKSCRISQSIELIDSLDNLENYLCQFITWLKKEDETDYKVESVHICYKKRLFLQLIISKPFSAAVINVKKLNIVIAS